jgi:hypothetical protein
MEDAIMMETKEDEVYQDDKKQVKITIKNMKGEVKVHVKPDLKDVEVLDPDPKKWKPDKDKMVINFYVMTTGDPPEYMTGFSPPMILEAGGGEEDQSLGYYVEEDASWKKFEDQDTQIDEETNERKAKVNIKNWAKDPQVAWGK